MVILYSILDQIEKNELIKFPVLAKCLVEIITPRNVYVELEGVYLGAEGFKNLLNVVFYKVSFLDLPTEDANI